MPYLDEDSIKKGLKLTQGAGPSSLESSPMPSHNPEPPKSATLGQLMAQFRAVTDAQAQVTQLEESGREVPCVHGGSFSVVILPTYPTVGWGLP